MESRICSKCNLEKKLKIVATNIENIENLIGKEA